MAKGLPKPFYSIHSSTHDITAFIQMAKVKGSSNHLRARLEYLHRAATYLQSASLPPSQHINENTDNEKNKESDAARIVPRVINSASGKIPPGEAPRETLVLSHQARMCISQMRGVSLKTLQRLPVEVKRSYCKRCETLLIPSVNCTQYIRNESRERKKPWADVRVVCCLTCGTEKRFPQAPNRSKKLSVRKRENEQKAQQDQQGEEQSTAT